MTGLEEGVVDRWSRKRSERNDLWFLGLRSPPLVRHSVASRSLHRSFVSHSFPPKLDKSNFANEREEDDGSIVPDEQIAQVLPFWDSITRRELRVPKFKKSQIDQRRSKVRLFALCDMTG